MKKFFLAALAASALTTLVMTSSTGCKKETCYECSKNVGQPDEAHWNMCNEDDHDRAVQSGYTCHKK